MRSSFLFIIATLVILASVESSSAQEQEEHRNHTGPFIGLTRSDLHDTVSFTAGFDYIRKFHDGVWGVGAIGEVVFADEPEYVFIVPVYREVGPLYVRSGPGFEYVSEGEEEEGEEEDEDQAGSIPKALDEDPEEDDPEGDETGGETTVLFRIGVGYEIEIKNGWTVTPSFDIDFGGRRNRFLVLGATIAKGF